MSDPIETLKDDLKKHVLIVGCTSADEIGIRKMLKEFNVPEENITFADKLSLKELKTRLGIVGVDEEYGIEAVAKKLLREYEAPPDPIDPTVYPSSTNEPQGIARKWSRRSKRERRFL